MTEAEWLRATDPGVLVRILWRQVREREVRLFSCACARAVWEHLQDRRGRRAVEVAERYVDGLAGRDELAAAGEEALQAIIAHRNENNLGLNDGEVAWSCVRDDWLAGMQEAVWSSEPTLSLAGQAMEWMGALTEPLRAARQRLESLVRRTEEISSAAAA